MGYRKMPVSPEAAKAGAEPAETWIARYRTEDGEQKYKSLGYVSEAFDFDAAKRAAEQWFKQKEADIKDEVVTVADACRRYVEERRTSKSEACARDAEARFERTVYDELIGKRPIAKIRAAQIKAWRDGLEDLSAASRQSDARDPQGRAQPRSARAQRGRIAGAASGPTWSRFRARIVVVTCS